MIPGAGAGDYRFGATGIGNAPLFDAVPPLPQEGTP